MNRSQILVLLMIGLVGLAGIGGGAVKSQSVERPADGAVDTVPAEPSRTVLSTSQSTSPREYIIVATTPAAVERARLQQYGEVGTQAGHRIELTTTPAHVPAIENLSWVRAVQTPHAFHSTTVAGAGTTETLGVSPLHERGITGDGVTVGVIDRGFDTGDPAIADNVVTVRRFAPRGSQSHGTNVAKTVLQTAPDADLLLTTAQSGVDTEAAIQYLTAQDVDIIVFSGGFLTLDDDGDHFLTDDITQARRAGTLFVVSAGNQAQLHWQGQFRDPDGDGILNATKTDERLCVPACDKPYSGVLRLALHWDDDGDESTYRVIVDNPFQSGVIAQSTARDLRGSERVSALTLSLAQQPVDIIIQHVSGPADDELELLVAGPPRIERAIARSSLTAPADTDPAVAVAAYRRDTASITTYSSQGPTDDGRTGVSVAGYTNVEVPENRVFTGTSAAAPSVAGVAALTIHASDHTLTPSQLETTLTTTSESVQPTQPSTVDGSGVVNATAAVDAVAPASPRRGPLTIDGGSVSPATVPTSTAVNQTVTVTVANLSSTAQTATIALTVPADATIHNISDVRVTDAAGVTIPLQRPPTRTNTENGTDTQLRVEIAPPETANTSAISMTVSVAATYAAVAQPTSRPVTATVTEPDGTNTGPTTVSTVTLSPPETEPQSPIGGLAGTYDSDADGTITARELGQAVTDYARGELTAAELGEVVTAFATR